MLKAEVQISVSISSLLPIFMLRRVSQLKDQITPTMAVVSDPKTPDINLYTTQTPNGIKVSIVLEELGFAAFFVLDSFV